MQQSLDQTINVLSGAIEYKISHQRNRCQKEGKPHENVATLLEISKVRFGGA